jgi:hypothetical protein
MKSSLIFTRPTTSVEFFSTKQVPENVEKADLLMFLYENEQKDTMNHTDVSTPDGLTLTRTFTWKDAASKEAFETEFLAKFKWFHDLRAIYLKDNGMTISVGATTE